MSVGSILLGLALLMLVILFISRPLMASRKARKRRETTYEGLLAQKEAVLTLIRALDFDYETGKVQEQDYQQQRASLMAEATDLLKQLDQLEGISEVPVPPAVTAEADRASGMDADIEAAVSRLRQERSKPSPTSKVMPARSSSTNGKTNYCPQCGQPADPEDKFCAHCGRQLHVPQHA